MPVENHSDNKANPCNHMHLMEYLHEDKALLFGNVAEHAS